MTAFIALVVISIIIFGAVHSYEVNRKINQMVITLPDPETGEVIEIAKYRKTWWDELVERMPAWAWGYFLGFATCAIILYGKV